MNSALQLLIDHAGKAAPTVGGPKLLDMDVNRRGRNDTLLHRAVRVDNPQALRVLPTTGAA